MSVDPNEIPEFTVYSTGLVYASVCTRLDDEEATERLNLTRPTGIEPQWKVSADETFATGPPNPCPCPDDPRNRHVLFSC